MAKNKNVDVVRKVEEAWAASEIEGIDKFFAPDFRTEAGFPGFPPTLESAKMAHQASMQSFPDRKMEILDIFGEGDRVCVRCRITGTNAGGLPAIGIPANNRSIDTQWISIYTLKGGKIVGHSAIIDYVTMLVQLGVMQPPGAPPA